MKFRNQNVGWVPLSFLVFLLLFLAWPDIDLKVSAFFFDPMTASFPANQLAWVQAVYVGFKDLPLFLVPALVIGILSTFFARCPCRVKSQRRRLIFLLLFLLIGPGLIVHAGFKNQWDRARPRDVVEFGGSHQFTPAWVISDQCDTNCSFTSGHAAMGFAFLALGWVWNWRLGLLLGGVLGLFVGEVRVMQGGHFLSDIIFSGYICYATAWLLAKLILPRDQKQDVIGTPLR